MGASASEVPYDLGRFRLKQKAARVVPAVEERRDDDQLTIV